MAIHFQVLVPKVGEAMITRTDDAAKFVHYKTPTDAPVRKQTVFELVETLPFNEEGEEAVLVYGECDEGSNRCGSNKQRALEVGRKEADKFLHPENYTGPDELTVLRARVKQLEDQLKENKSLSQVTQKLAELEAQVKANAAVKR